MTKAIHRMALRPAAAVATLWSSTPMVGLRSLMLLRLMIAAEMGGGGGGGGLDIHHR